jgi:hypothetical protein
VAKQAHLSRNRHKAEEHRRQQAKAQHRRGHADEDRGPGAAEYRRTHGRVASGAGHGPGTGDMKGKAQHRRAWQTKAQHWREHPGARRNPKEPTQANLQPLAYNIVLCFGKHDLCRAAGACFGRYRHRHTLTRHVIKIIFKFVKNQF